MNTTPQLIHARFEVLGLMKSTLRHDMRKTAPESKRTAASEMYGWLLELESELVQEESPPPQKPFPKVPHFATGLLKGESQ